MKKTSLLALSVVLSQTAMSSTMSLHAAAATVHRDTIAYKGTVVSAPYSVIASDSGNQTTFIPIAYLMGVLKSKLNIQSAWDGHSWQLTTPTTVSVKSSGQARSTGADLYVNGQFLMNVPSLVSVDPASKVKTTYVPIYYVKELLQSIGIPSIWNGSEWNIGVVDLTADRNQAIQLKHSTVDGESVYSVVVDLTDAHVSVQPEMAGKFGTVKPLSAFATSSTVVAAINGTVFNSWSNMWPDGAIEINGDWVHGGKGTILGFGSNGKVGMFRATSNISLSFGGVRVWPWYVNSWTGASDSMAVLTPDFGSATNIKSGTAVVVQNGIVTSITSGSSTAIPSDGYVVEFTSGSYNSNVLSNVTVGEQVQYSVGVQDLNNNPIDFSDLNNALGCGPMLVNQSKVVLDPALEGFTDPTLVNPNTQRSFVGILPNGKLLLATIHSATLSSEAVIAKDMGCVQAMNLDGGASTGLYYNGQTVVSPGRNLCNALVVTYK